MKLRAPIWIQEHWIALRSSFWFIPTAMVGCGLGLAVLMIYLDQRVDITLADRFPTLFGANASGARSVLGAIASSMITVAGVTFSVTIVALSLASNQYTPRILRNFMRDRGNQLVLGVFVSVFVYSLVVLRAIRGGDESFIPSFSLLVGIGLAIVAILFLIYFVHHIASMVQASTILANIYEETRKVIESICPEGAPPAEDDPAEERLSEPSAVVLSTRTGYIQNIDRDALVTWAEEESTVIELICGIGTFVIAGAPVLKVGDRSKMADEAARRLNDSFSIARARTIEQDPGFGIRQMVDVALKALSPGINDVTTAATCVDYLGALIFHLGNRQIPSNRCFKNGRLRLIACGETYRSLVNLAFREIRQNGRTNVPIYIKLLEAAEKAAPAEAGPERLELLWSHAVAVAREADRSVHHPADREQINESLAKAASRLQRDFRGVALAIDPSATNATQAREAQF